MNIKKYLVQITNSYLKILKNFSDITVYGKQSICIKEEPYLERGPVIAFNIEGVHPYDFCQIMGQHDISLRSGNHCAQPLLKKLNLNATARASFGIYNTKDDVDKFIDAIKETKKFFK